MGSLFVVAAYNAAREFETMVTGRNALVVSPSHNQVGSATLSLSVGHDKTPALMAPGTRVKIWYRGEELFSGDVDEDASSGGPLDGEITFSIRDHKAILWDMLAFPVPTSGLYAQTSEFHTLTGPAETVFKTLVTANVVSRAGFPGVVVAPDQGRGDDITVQLRFDSIGEIVVPLVDAAGLGVSVVLTDDGNLLVDCYQAGTYPLPFSLESGTLAERNWSRKKPTATRCILGGVGDGVDRIFDQVTDPDMEATYGMIAETFIDTSNTGKMVTDQWKAIEDAQRAVESASSAIQGPANTRSDARSRLDAATAERKSALAALEAAAAAHEISMLRNVAAEKAITLPLYTAANSKSSSASSALDSAQTAYNNANSNYSTASSNLSSARSALTAARNALPAKITAHRAELRALGALKLAQMGAKAGIQLAFAETDAFAYGGKDGATVGQFLELRLLPKRIVDGVEIPAVVLTDIMRTAVITEKSPTHADIAPDVGDFNPLPEQVHAMVTAKNTTDIRSKGRHR